MLSSKPQINSELLFLKIPPQEDVGLLKASSVLQFTQRLIGECQITSLMSGAFGG
jgi:hypothetical protein